MALPRHCERLTIYLDQTAHHGRVPEFVEIVERARARHMAGATVLQAMEGFGQSARVHRRHALSVTDDVPVVVVIVDTTEHIDAFLPEVQRLMPHGLVTRQPVEVIVQPAADRQEDP